MLIVAAGWWVGLGDLLAFFGEWAGYAIWDSGGFAVEQFNRRCRFTQSDVSSEQRT